MDRSTEHLDDIPLIGIVTVSDRASRGVYDDLGGPAIEAFLTHHLATAWQPERRLVADEQHLEAVADKVLPGFGELMRQVSLTVGPTAILSRQTAAVRGTSLIVNLPGKPSAIDDCLRAVLPAIPYCIDLIGGPRLDTTGGISSFRPKA